MKTLLTSPVSTWKHWGIILMVALAFAFTPQFQPNDWERNTAGLVNGLDIYRDPSYVYPPWALLMLWPYRLITDVGARIASVLVIGWLVQRSQWSLMKLFAIVLSPFFIWTMILSNADLLTLLLPVLLWTNRGRFKEIRQTIALALLLVKPQGGFLLILYWLWQERRITRPMIVVGSMVIVFSLIGSPMLLLQWLQNVTHPSDINVMFWHVNNISLSSAIGLIPAIVLVVPVVYKWRKYPEAVLLWAALLLSSYASNQSLIAPFALVASWPATLVQFLVVGSAGTFHILSLLNPLWAYLLGIATFFLAERFTHKAEPVLIAAPQAVE